MKRPVIDYTQFRFSRLNEPRFQHMWLLLGWVGYLLLYFITENLIPFDKCHVIHGRLDDLIPFNEFFALFYCFWYLFLVGSLLYFFLYHVPSFKKLQTYIIITQIVAMTAYIVYPSVQNLRPETFPRDNFLTRVMAFIYSFDTPSGVCPSLHVAYSAGIASAWCRYERAPAWWKALSVVLAAVISISTAFVKQHSVVDIFAALPVCLLAEIIVFVKLPRGRTKLQNWLERDPVQ